MNSATFLVILAGGSEGEQIFEKYKKYIDYWINNSYFFDNYFRNYVLYRKHT